MRGWSHGTCKAALSASSDSPTPSAPSRNSITSTCKWNFKQAPQNAKNGFQYIYMVLKMHRRGPTSWNATSPACITAAMAEASIS
jgi:hypothetical protein